MLSALFVRHGKWLRVIVADGVIVVPGNGSLLINWM